MPDGESPTIYALGMATQADFDQMLVVLFEMHKEVGLFPLAPIKVAQMLDAVLKVGFPIVARTPTGIIAGTIGLIRGQPWYSDAVFISDRWFFVRPPHRRSRVAENMVEGAKVVARQEKLPLGMVVQSQPDAFRKNALLARHMTPIGEAFIYSP